MEIKLVPQWRQTRYRDLPVTNEMAGLREGARKAAKGGYVCLRTFARKRGLTMRLVRIYADE